MKRILLIIAFIVVMISTKAQTPKFNQNLLLGTWVSADDKNSKKKFLKSSIVNYYNNEETDKGNYKITYEKDLKSYVITETVFDQGVYRYSLNALTPNTLKLTYLKRGNTLLYKRVKSGLK